MREIGRQWEWDCERDRVNERENDIKWQRNWGIENDREWERMR